MESVAEKEAKRFWFPLTLWPPRKGQGQWKWYKMVEVSGAYKNGRYEKSGVTVCM